MSDRGSHLALDDDVHFVRSDTWRPRRLPVLDLESSGPLPKLKPLSATGQDSTTQSSRKPAQDGDIWLVGGALMCACPDCQSPMTIRLWLMVADCWHCGTAIELTEEQERAARRLARKAAARATPGSPVSRQPMAKESATPVDRPRRETRPLAVPRPTPKREPLHLVRPPRPEPFAPLPPPRESAVRATQLWLSHLLRSLPAWLISFLFHIALIAILAALTLRNTSEDDTITLATTVNRLNREGGDRVRLNSSDTVQFELPIPERDRPRNQRQREAMILADQQAKELRVDPETLPEDLPDLSHIKRLIATTSVPQRTLAVRDPRIRVQMIEAEGGTTLTEAAVARGLRWMAIHQNQDGSWSLNRFDRVTACRGRCDGRSHLRSDAAATSLCLLPFLGAGQTHQAGRYKDVVSMGLRWLIDRQKPNGDLRMNAPNNAAMYVQGQATIVLCEAFGMTRDETLRGPAQAAVDFIVTAQHPAGGWRYQPGQPGDTSVLGWQLMALQSAKSAGLEVPAETIELADMFLDSVQSRDGIRYAYIQGREPDQVMTAEAILCRMYTGYSLQDPGVRNGIRYLVVRHPPSTREVNVYYWYYATQVLHHAGGREWQLWNERMRDVLLATQAKRGHEAGSWSPSGPHSQTGGRMYMTALAVCTLEVYYRHAPIFRQLDLR